MNILGKSGQHVGDNSSAIQVTGNATFGPTITEVVTLCELVVKSQMATLRADAYKVVDERAREFGNQIASKLATDLDEKLKQKLADPDVQYSINQAVTQVARKGFDEKSELLKELLVTKIETDDESDNALLDYALEVTSKLTTNEIKFLSLVYYLRSVIKLSNNIDITTIAANKILPPGWSGFSLEQIHELHKGYYGNYDLDYIKFLGPLSSLKKINKDHLNMKGVVFYGKTYTSNYSQLLAKRTGVESFENEQDFFETFPAFKLILDAFGVSSLEDLNGIVSNPVGDIIAANYLKACDFME